MIKFASSTHKFTPPTDNLNIMTRHDAKDYFTSRATVRNYTGQKISDEMLDDILEKAMRAPTCGNMQLYSVIVTREEAAKKTLAAQHFNQPAATGADIILTVCADFSRFTRWCSLRGADPGYDNFHSFVVALTDAVIYAQQIVTVAEMEGLGSCYLGTVNYNAEEISRLLELPDLVVPVAAISLGYPAGETSQCERLPLRAVRHDETYRKDSDEEILSLFKGKEEFPENKKFEEENGMNLAKIFTDIRYNRATNESVSESFAALLRKKGFM